METTSRCLSQLRGRRIVLATTTRSKGGVWRHIFDLGRLLARADLDVVLGLSPDATLMQDSARDGGLPWRPLRDTALMRDTLWHVHLGNTYNVTALGLLALRRGRGPAVITEHLPRNHASDPRLEPHHRRRPGAYTAKGTLKRLELRFCDQVIAVSDSSARFMRERYRLSGDGLTVVRNGVSSPATSPPAPAPVGRPLRVLAIGSMGRQKGFDVLIEAVARSRGDWRVTIAGDGFQGANLQTQASRTGRGRIAFPGWVDGVEALILDADVICMPSRWESFPYTALEAMVLRRPVVGTRVDGLDEIIDERCGVLVAPDDPDGLAAALDDLAGDPARLTRLGVGAGERAERYTPAAMLAGTLEVYARAWGVTSDGRG